MTNRKFAHFTKSGRGGLGISEIPKDGFCISVFLIIRERNNPRRVLMGYINSRASWDHIGALDPERVRAHSNGWMLPSCHIIYGESPIDAAERVAREQLGVDKIKISGPKVFSEVYAPVRHPQAKGHWDLQFLFEGKLPGSLFKKQIPNAWTRLEFVDIDKKNKIARSHEDILARL
ncbi:MAG: NUDIX hydrolase [Nitrososphaerales archaeon]